MSGSHTPDDAFRAFGLPTEAINFGVRRPAGQSGLRPGERLQYRFMGPDPTAHDTFIPGEGWLLSGPSTTVRPTLASEQITRVSGRYPHGPHNVDVPRGYGAVPLVDAVSLPWDLSVLRGMEGRASNPPHRGQWEVLGQEQWRTPRARRYSVAEAAYQRAMWPASTFRPERPIGNRWSMRSRAPNVGMAASVSRPRSSLATGGFREKKKSRREVRFEAQGQLPGMQGAGSYTPPADEGAQDFDHPAMATWAPTSRRPSRQALVLDDGSPTHTSPQLAATALSPTGAADLQSMPTTQNLEHGPGLNIGAGTWGAGGIDGPDDPFIP